MFRKVASKISWQDFEFSYDIFPWGILWSSLRSTTIERMTYGGLRPVKLTRRERLKSHFNATRLVGNEMNVFPLLGNAITT